MAINAKLDRVERAVVIPAGRHRLEGILTVPSNARGTVLFAHGSGSGRFSPRNQFVAHVLEDGGLATLLLDLLEEAEADDRQKVFDIDLLADRLLNAIDWLGAQPDVAHLPIGIFGASTGGGAALVAAARRPEQIAAVVSRGGRPDLAGARLPDVRSPTLLLVGENDEIVVDLNEKALSRLRSPKKLVVIPGATHLFPEEGALEEVARLAKEWFIRYLSAPSLSTPSRRVYRTATKSNEAAMFRDRADAANQLVGRLKGRELHDPLVLGIPRGGVVLGAVLARELGAQLDVVLSRKLRAPLMPELAAGAIGEDGRIFINPHADRIPGLTREYLEEERRCQLAEIERRKQLFRGDRPAAPITGRSVVVTDDGIATGSTLIAALKIIRAQDPREVIVAVPVASPDRLPEVRRWCDEVISLLLPEDFEAIGEFYKDFHQLDDNEVIELLRESKHEEASEGSHVGEGI